MTPAEEQAVRANMIAVFTWVVIPVCLVATLVQLWLLSRTRVFTHVRQLLPAIVLSPLLMIPLMFAFAWILDRLPGGIVRAMYFPLHLASPDFQFDYLVFAPAVAAAVVAYTLVGRVLLRRALRSNRR